MAVSIIHCLKNSSWEKYIVTTLRKRRVSTCSGRKITESLGNVTVRGEKDGKSKRGARLSTVCLSMYSVTENIYCSQLSSVVILLQPEPNCFTSYNTRKDWVLSPNVLSPCGNPLPLTCLLVTVNELRSYFAPTITISASFWSFLSSSLLFPDSLIP
jgi:hypothetical protein